MIAGAIVLAAAGWAFAFGLAWGNFWIKIGITVVAVCAYSLAFRKPELRIRTQSVVEGIVLAAILYGVFYVGFALAPRIVPGASGQVGGIYSLGEGSSRVWIFLLLCFITGPGEEIFWRGFLQDALQKRLTKVPGFLLATAIYAGVHVFSGNLMLILAALVAGAFWGALYAWRRDLVALVVSHSLWSAFIFAIAPIR